MPKFSVIIPLYNKERYICRAIQSVLAQTFQNYEIIIVNDGSTDNGVQIIQEINDDRIRIFEQHNAGVSSARNKGIEEATSEYCAFLDADDEWKPEFLEVISGLIENFPDAKCFSTAYDLQIDGKSKKINFWPYDHNRETGIIENYFLSRIKGGHLVFTSATCVARNTLIELNGFPIGEKMGEDQDLWIRIALNYEIAYSKNICTIYHASLPDSACAVNLPDEKIIYLKNLKELLKKNLIKEDLIPHVKLFIESDIIEIARSNIVNNQGRKGRAILLKTSIKKLLIQKYFWILISYISYSLLRTIR